MSNLGKETPSAEYLAECFEYLPGGVLVWRSRPAAHFASERTARMWNAKNAGRLAGRRMPGDSGYIQIGLDKKRHLLHRLIAAMHGIDTSAVIDHVDGDTSNNRVGNLRGCTRQQNTMNNTGWSGRELPLGVSKVRSGKFVAYIRADGRHKHLGTFDTWESALSARLGAESEQYQGFARRGAQAYLSEVAA